MNPLREYLLKSGATQGDIAREIARLTGARINRDAVSRWARGYHVPRMATRVMIEQATRGKVKAKAWIGLQPEGLPPRKAKPKARR